MPSCEICGKQEMLYRAEIEGIALSVCQNCSKFGRVILAPEPPKSGKISLRPYLTPQKRDEPNEAIIEKYGELIKNAREQKGLSQEDFAKKINEKTSLIHKLETNSHEPSIDLAKKIERFLKIRLITQDDEGEKPKPEKSGILTIGDIVSRKKP